MQVNYVRCLDVDYSSERKEPFWDVQLNIRDDTDMTAPKPLRTVEEAFRHFVKPEVLDDLYDASEGGFTEKQKAEKGIKFVSFPPVLTLQLKRFQFDIQHMDMVKLNSFFEFPDELDVTEFLSSTKEADQIKMQVDETTPETESKMQTEDQPEQQADGMDVVTEGTLIVDGKKVRGSKEADDMIVEDMDLASTATPDGGLQSDAQSSVSGGAASSVADANRKNEAEGAGISQSSVNVQESSSGASSDKHGKPGSSGEEDERGNKVIVGTSPSAGSTARALNKPTGSPDSTGGQGGGRRGSSPENMSMQSGGQYNANSGSRGSPASTNNAVGGNSSNGAPGNNSAEQQQGSPGSNVDMDVSSAAQTNKSAAENVKMADGEDSVSKSKKSSSPQHNKLQHGSPNINRTASSSSTATGSATKKAAGQDNIYKLYAVMVHKGCITAGHYYAMLRPFGKNWLRFDDERIQNCSAHAAVRDNYGGDTYSMQHYYDAWNDYPTVPMDKVHDLLGGASAAPDLLGGGAAAVAQTRTRIHSAYMLVYVKKSLFAELMRPPDPYLVNPTMCSRIVQRERILEARKLRDRVRQRRVTVKFMLEKDLVRCVDGFGMHNCTSHSSASTFSAQIAHVERDTTIKELTETVAEMLDVNPRLVSLFMLTFRDGMEVATGKGNQVLHPSDCLRERQTRGQQQVAGKQIDGRNRLFDPHEGFRDAATELRESSLKAEEGRRPRDERTSRFWANAMLRYWNNYNYIAAAEPHPVHQMAGQMKHPVTPGWLMRFMHTPNELSTEFFDSAKELADLQSGERNNASDTIREYLAETTSLSAGSKQVTLGYTNIHFG